MAWGCGFGQCCAWRGPVRVKPSVGEGGRGASSLQGPVKQQALAGFGPLKRQRCPAWTNGLQEACRQRGLPLDQHEALAVVRALSHAAEGTARASASTAALLAALC